MITQDELKARLKNLYEVDFIPKITDFNVPTFEESPHLLMKQILD